MKTSKGSIDSQCWLLLGIALFCTKKNSLVPGFISNYIYTFTRVLPPVTFKKK